MNVQAYITSADYPRVNHPSPLPADRDPTPDLQFTIEVDVRGFTIPASGHYLIPDLRELERLLLEPIAAAVASALQA